MNYLIINEQHNLFPEQVKLLEGFGDVKFISIPKEGINKKQMESFESDNKLESGDTIIFASPIPYLLKLLSRELDYFDSQDMSVPGVQAKYNVLVFHNDKREKKELPNGKIINTVSAEGWELV